MPIRSAISRYYIPIGMYRSVENDVPTESSHSVGMPPCDLPNGGIPTEYPCVGNLIFYRAMQTYGLQRYDTGLQRYDITWLLRLFL
ncbi:MAG: hypothetical protein LBQ66_04915 [Planctomycetaceae bacterium]|nr:hypothetical protein [Planctomycetaceae bacterium]